METRDRSDARARLERAQGQSSGRSARAQARALASAAVRRSCRAWPRTPLPGAVRSGGIHGLGPGARGVEEFQRQRPRARRATGPRGQDGAGDPRFPRLLHGARRQPVRELERDRPLRRLSDARARAICRPRVPHARFARTPRLLRQVLRGLRRDASRHEVRLDLGRVRRFLAAVWKKPKLSTAEGHCIMNLCMAATYDPDPAAPNGFRLPFNLETGEVLPERWRQWQRHDPVRLVERYKRNLRSLRGIYIDCGWRDQFHIHYGSRILSQRLHQAGIHHVYEEFDDDHSDIDYRMDVSLTFLYRALKP